MAIHTDPQSTIPAHSLFTESRLTRRTLLGNGSLCIQIEGDFRASAWRS